MKRYIAFAARLAITASAVSLAGAAMADTVYNTSLQNVNGVFGSSTATTTTNANGTATTVTGPGPNAGVNRAQGTPVFDTWFQANVGAGSTVGITTDYAQSGNGSAYFNSTQGDTGKADLQYYFGNATNTGVAPVSLASLTSVSYDFYRDSASTTNATFAPVLRFDILKNGAFAGALIFENAYNPAGPPQPVPVNSWTTLTADLTNGIWWTNNASLGPVNAAAAGGTKTLAQWIAANVDANGNNTLSVYGLEIGIGSGWNNTFYGAVDNVQVAFNARTVNSNFEVAAGAVPEPASWALMLVGFGAVGGAMRMSRKGRNAIA